MKFARIGGYLSTLYRVCTKAVFTSKGSYGNVEPKNAILVSVQKAYFPLRGCKLPGFTLRCKGQTMKFAEIGATFPHGTVFPLRQYLHQKEATGM